MSGLWGPRQALQILQALAQVAAAFDLTGHTETEAAIRVATKVKIDGIPEA